MASENKKKKLKNSGGCDSLLKEKKLKLKRGAFYNASKRREDNKIEILEKQTKL